MVPSELHLSDFGDASIPASMTALAMRRLSLQSLRSESGAPGISLRSSEVYRIYSTRPSDSSLPTVRKVGVGEAGEVKDQSLSLGWAVLYRSLCFGGSGGGRDALRRNATLANSTMYGMPQAVNRISGAMTRGDDSGREEMVEKIDDDDKKEER